jgi:hypothetical protein
MPIAPPVAQSYNILFYYSDIYVHIYKVSYRARGKKICAMRLLVHNQNYNIY